MSGRKKVFTNYQYPFPAEPSKWDQEERNFSQGLRHLFDILFSRKVQNVLIADGAVTSRNIKSESVGLRHLVNGFGRDLDISDNETVGLLTSDIEAAQNTADDAVADAATAQSTADAAASAASNAQTTANTAVSSAAAAQSTADGAVTAAAEALSTANSAQSTADAVPNTLYPIGIIILNNTAPSFGTWEQVDIGVQAVTAWRRTA